MTLFEYADASPAPEPCLIELRPYQDKAIERILDARDRGRKRVLIVAATGAGKTTIFSRLIDVMGLRSLIVAHREELLQQAKDRIHLMAPGLSVGIERAQERAARSSDVIVGSVQTLGRPGPFRLEGYDPELLIVDEAHHCAADSYVHVMRQTGVFDDRCFMLGCTATPHRMDNKPLHGDEGAIFEECVFTYGILDAIADGYLVDIRGYQVKSGVDLSKVKTTAGDFNQKQLAAAVNDEKRNGAALKHWLEVAKDRPTMVFCASVAHAHDMAALFRSHGFTAAAVDGTTHPEDRARITRDFQEGRTQVLCNMAVFTEGFDAPRCSCVIMLRPTQSWTVFVQAAGRGLRPFPGKEDCIVIDVVDNAGRHSLASVPAMVGLPAKINLQGHTLTEAHKKVQSAGRAAAALIGDAPLDFGVPDQEIDFDKLDTVLSNVNMLAQIRPPEEVAAISRLLWLPIPGDALMLSAGDDKSARLVPDTLGNYKLTISLPSGEHEYEAGDNLLDAVRFADRQVRFYLPSALTATDTRWRTEAPSDKQAAWLRKRKVAPEIIARMTKGDASAMITQLMNQGRGN